MVDGQEFIQTMQQGAEEPVPKLATVEVLFTTGTAKVKFYGEETASEKEYSYLASYIPTLGDTILMLPFNGTYIIIGKLVYGVVNEGETFLTTEDLNIILEEYVQVTDLESYVSKTYLTSQLTSYSRTSHTHDQVEGNSCTAGFNSILSSSLAYFVPNKSGIALGNNSSDRRWKELYASSATIITSDLRLKNSVESIPEVYKQMVLKLDPIIFKMNDGESDRYHAGLGAQHVEEVMMELEMDSKDFAGFIKTPRVDEEGAETGEYEYALRYEEFISPIIAVTKDNTKDIETIITKIKGLEAENTELKSIIKELAKRVEKLEGGEQ
jgi:hypothetical protein